MGTGSAPSGLSMAVNNPGASMGFSPGGVAHNTAMQTSWGVQSTMPAHVAYSQLPPNTGGGFLDNLSFGNMYGFVSGMGAITKGLTELRRSQIEQQSYEWKAEIYKRQWQLKQRQIEDRKITGKKEEDALRRKYLQLKKKITPAAGKRGILVGGGSVMDILAGIEVTELADRGLLKTNVQKDIYGIKVGQWSDRTEEAMYRRRAEMTSPGRAAGMTMLTSAMQSGMKYWQYKNSMPGSVA